MRIAFIDNGTTGSIGYYDGSGSEFMLTPIKKEQDYTKAKKTISRIDSGLLFSILADLTMKNPKENLMAVMERPLINPVRFTTSVVAARAFEATLVVIEQMNLPHMFCDSKEWQRGLLPSSGQKGVDSATLKKESADIGIRFFPQHRETILKHKDADGILGAYQFWRKLNGAL